MRTRRLCWAIVFAGVTTTANAQVIFGSIGGTVTDPGGLALRFARVKGYREDKSAQNADTIDTVRDIYLQSLGKSGFQSTADGRGER